jgi:4-cresol dehydrogenase (hydroxylating)
MPDSSPLPPSLSARHFAASLKSFEAALGAEWVVSDPAKLAEFYDPYNLPSRTDFKPSAALFPASVEEIQAVLRIANEQRIPLWTVSQGRNNAYGGAAPRLPGAVLLHLRRMNRVLEIDEDNAYAVVEPGVRFFDLYEAIRAGGHRLTMSVPDLGWAALSATRSIMASATRPMATTAPRNAAWRWCWRTAISSAPAWAR